MTMEAMTAFLQKARNDESFSEKLAAIVERERTADAVCDAVCALAATNGFDVTKEDARTLLPRQQSVSREDGALLSDEDLDGVAGGMIYLTWNGERYVGPNGELY